MLMDWKEGYLVKIIKKRNTNHRLGLQQSVVEPDERFRRCPTWGSTESKFLYVSFSPTNFFVEINHKVIIKLHKTGIIHFNSICFTI